MQFRRASAQRRRLISLTPLIDVVFILLLFFMLASNLTQWRAIQINTPSAGAATVPEQLPLVLRVDAGGGVVWNGASLNLARLGQTRLGTLLRDQPEQRLIVQPDPEVSLQMIVDVLEQLQTAGAKRIVLQRPPP